MKKKLTILLLIFTFIFGLTLTQTVTAEEPKEDETYLYSTKSGVLQKVYHYGKGGEVTIPKNFTVYESEMRGIWVATVYNIAIGKQQGTSQSAIDDYKAEFLSILDRMEEFGMNTLYFQIRPSNDAFYKSELNPWSQYLVGPGIDPGWDPLTWMIDETHKRGFDFQCWMNAYRVTTHSVLPDGDAMASVYSNDQLLQYKNEALKGLADKNFAKLHPEYVVLGEYDTRLILNPSEVAVQQFIVDSLKEIIKAQAGDEAAANPTTKLYNQAYFTLFDDKTVDLADYQYTYIGRNGAYKSKSSLKANSDRLLSAISSYVSSLEYYVFDAIVYGENSPLVEGTNYYDLTFFDYNETDFASLEEYKANSELYNAVKDFVQDSLKATDESFATSVASAADTYGSKLAREQEVKDSAANWNK